VSKEGHVCVLLKSLEHPVLLDIETPPFKILEQITLVDSEATLPSCSVARFFIQKSFRTSEAAVGHTSHYIASKELTCCRCSRSFFNLMQKRQLCAVAHVKFPSLKNSGQAWHAQQLLPFMFPYGLSKTEVGSASPNLVLQGTPAKIAKAN